MMTDPLTAMADKLVAAGIINLGTDINALAAIINDALISVYLTASVSGAAMERKRILDIATAMVDSAAGDTSLGKAILKKIEGK